MRIYILLILIFVTSISYAINFYEFTGNGEREYSSSKGSLPNIDECIDFIYQGEYDKAIDALLEHKIALENSSRFNIKVYAKIMTNLVDAYIFDNNIINARQVIDELKDKIGIENLDSNNLFKIYYAEALINKHLENWDRTIEFSKKALFYIEKQNAFQRISILTTLAYSYSEKGDAIRELLYIEEVLDVFKNNADIFQSNRGEILYVDVITQLVTFYKKMDREDLAIQLLKTSIEEPLNDNNKLGLYNSLARTYIEQGEPLNAVSLLEGKEIIGNTTKETLMDAYYLSNDKKIIDLLHKYNLEYIDNALNIFSLFSVNENDEYWNNISSNLMFYNNLVADRYADKVDMAYDNILFIKNLKLLSSSAIRNKIKADSEDLLKDAYRNVCFYRDKIIYNAESRDSIDVWRDRLADYEKLLLSNIPNLKQDIISAITTWKDVREQLTDEDIAIEFTLIPNINDYPDDISFNIAAILLTNNSEIPEIKILTVKERLDNLTVNINEPLSINELYQLNDSNSVYSLIWEKLEPYMVGKKNIFFSPIGELNSINHSALLDRQGDMLGEKYNLVRVSSTAIINEVKNSVNYDCAAVYGGVKFDGSVSEMESAAKPYNEFGKGEFVALRSESDRGKWDYLPGTKVEAEHIHNLLGEKGISSNIYLSTNANEESVKQFSGGSPSILHLATHGFFVQTESQLNSNLFMISLGEYTKREDYKTHSGLLLAGANNVWTGKATSLKTEDGILTADEISRLDLSNTSLVVLSACETAKGHIDYIEGVYGLQRAFKEAGVKTIIMSLWKVDDDATQLFMNNLYSYLLDGAERHDALNKAMFSVKQQYPDPYYWAGFVMLD